MKSDMPITNLHRNIASHPHGWLNTSRPLETQDLQGRIILLDFWTYCCINCMHVIPDLKYLEDKFGSQLTVIGIHSAKFNNEKDSENIRQAILRYSIHHPVVNDRDFSIWNAFGANAWPTFMLINPKGTIQATYSGEGNRAALERDIAGLIKQYDKKINTAPLPIALEAGKQPPSALSFPSKLVYAPDFSGKPAMMVSDSGHNRIVVLGLDGTVLETVGNGDTGHKNGNFEEAQFNHPQGLAYDSGLLYVADTENHLIRVINFNLGAQGFSVGAAVFTIAGTGQQGHERTTHNKAALKTSLSSPWDVAFSPDKKSLIIAMAGTHQLWNYDIDTKTVSVIAGNGRESIDDGRYPGNSLSQPSGLSATPTRLYFVDAETSSLRILDKGQITTLIGTGLFDFGYKDGKKGTARMQHPLGVYADASGVYIADSYNHSIRSYDPATGVLSSLAGHGERGNKDGAVADAEFNEPNDVLRVGDKLYVADTNNNAIRVIDLKSKTVSTLTVKEPQRDRAPEFSKQLPNLAKMAATAIDANTAATVTLQLKTGWHINAEAPSGLALFDMAGKKPKAIASFNRDAIRQGKITLPELAKGSFHLQGTLYYCEDKEGSQCLVKSFDIPIKPQKSGAKDITLKLQ
jgi:DNA-binding beta-propeller fold protein YncE/thiol-disulfide isomerase/thioredoxin